MKRRLRTYGGSLACGNGTRIEISESSIGGPPQMWLRVWDPAHRYAAAILNVRQARALIRRLERWIEDAEAGR